MRSPWRPGCCICSGRACWSCWAAAPGAGWFFAEVASTGAMLLARACSSRSPQVREHLPDGSYLSCLDGLEVRIIEADLAVTGADGSRIGDRYRLITTLTDHRRFPATALVRLYHERWEIESAFLALRHTLLAGRVLRSGDRPGVEQELWALLTLYQLLHMAMVDVRQGGKSAGSARHTHPLWITYRIVSSTARRQCASGRPPAVV